MSSRLDTYSSGRVLVSPSLLKDTHTIGIMVVTRVSVLDDASLLSSWYHLHLDRVIDFAVPRGKEGVTWCWPEL